MHDVPCLRALVHTSVSGALRANQKNPWHICLMFHACEHLSTLPFRGRYEQTWKKPWHIVTFHAVHTSVSGALRANLKNMTYDDVPCLRALVHTSVSGALRANLKKQNIWRSMLTSTVTCPHFRFGGATSKLEKTWHMTVHACENLSTLPFRGFYEQTWKNMTYDDVPCLRALVHFFFVSGALRANLKKHDIWRSMLASTCSLFFLFRGRCAQTWKTWHMTFHACEHLSTPRRTTKQAVQFGESTGHLSDLSKDHICVYMHIYIYISIDLSIIKSLVCLSNIVTPFIAIRLIGERWRCWNATLQVDSFTDAADMV